MAIEYSGLTIKSLNNTTKEPKTGMIYTTHSLKTIILILISIWKASKVKFTSKAISMA